MTLRHLRIFVVVADTGKMSLAAEKLHISQPSVSQAIRELEEYYHFKLFERLSKRIYITERGKAMLDYARHITDSFDKMEEYALDASTQNIIRIGASVSVGTFLLPKLVSLLEEKVSGVDIRVNVNNTSVIESMVLDNTLDIAIVEGIVHNTALLQKPIADDELVIVAGRTHPLFKQDTISIEEFTAQNLISRESGSSDRNQFEQFMLEKGIQMKSTWKCTNTETIKQALFLGKGLAIMSEMLVRDEVASGEFKILKLEDIRIKRKLNLIYHPNKFITSSMDTFMKICFSL